MDIDHIKKLNEIAQIAAQKITIVVVPELKKHIRNINRQTSRHPCGSEGYWFQMGVKSILLDAAMMFPNQETQMNFLLAYAQRQPSGTILVETE